MVEGEAEEAAVSVLEVVEGGQAFEKKLLQLQRHATKTMCARLLF